MILQEINIVNFKNIEATTLSLSPKLNCFIGNNGEGKTNLLDAVYFLSFCRSAFNSIDSQLILHDRDFFVLQGDYLDDNGEREEIYCGLKRGTRKHFKRNKKEYKRFSQHIGLIPLVFVSPSDTNLVTGGSEQRRKLMDMVISQYDREYMDYLLEYNKFQQQRNVLLKQENEPDPSLMDILEEGMAKNGEVIFRKRNDFVEKLIPVFQQIYSKISKDNETVSLRYTSHCQRGSLLDIIRRDRQKDRILGFGLHGTHRDDLEMLVDGYQMKREGSQGQIKTYVIALKLAQFDFLKHKTSKTTPLLLLDDIFDKLDVRRVEEIIRLVSSEHYGQIFLTDTNRQHLDKILKTGAFNHQLFDVENGTITPVN